jgi:hypothetical protein
MFAWEGGRFRIALCEIAPGPAFAATTGELLGEAFGGGDYGKIRPGK